jgi:hypothetical protein
MNSGTYTNDWRRQIKAIKPKHLFISFGIGVPCFVLAGIFGLYIPEIGHMTVCRLDRPVLAEAVRIATAAALAAALSAVLLTVAGSALWREVVGRPKRTTCETDDRRNGTTTKASNTSR